MALLIICPSKDPQPWQQAISEFDPDIDIRIWPQVGNKDDIEFALCWNQPKGICSEFKNLKTICSMGAGVDHIICDKSIDDKINICRLIDDHLSDSMSEYLLASIYSIKQHLFRYFIDSKQNEWHPRKPYPHLNIGIMGLGKIGSEVCLRLSRAGFNVSGWAKTEHHIDAVQCFHGEQQKAPFLSTIQILVCLLPLTEDTKGILNNHLFQLLPKGAHIINVARGDHLVEKDLIANLNSNHIKSALLDVFSQEPLPKQHPFWERDDIFITPHISSLSQPESVSKQIVANYHLTLTGKGLNHQIDRERGY